VSAGAPAPDLRESAIALDPRSFRAVVHDGALLQRGMPRFEMFSNAQVDELYAYIRSRARVAFESRAK
jgi:quinohemoprotein ethanol dehydrogenase